MGRYLERAENYARFVSVNINLSMDLPTGLKAQWQPLIIATGDDELYQSTGRGYSREEALFFLVFDLDNPNSIRSTISKGRENARVVRENLSKETWEILNGMYHFTNDAAKKEVWWQANPYDFFDGIKSRSRMLYGHVTNTGLRDEGWYFLNLGTLVERADMTSRILDLKYHVLLPSVDSVGSPLDILHWTALLKSVGGYNAYRRLNGPLTPDGVVQFLVLEMQFPRSIAYCTRLAERFLRKISGTGRGDGFSNQAEKLVGSLRADLEFMDVSDVIQHGLHEYLDKSQRKFIEITNAIHQEYFKIQDNFTFQNQIQE